MLQKVSLVGRCVPRDVKRRYAKKRQKEGSEFLRGAGGRCE